MRMLCQTCAALAFGALVACGPAHHAEPPLTPDGALVYSASDIAKMQVSTAWDVVARSGRMNMSEATDGSSAVIRNRRGRSSILLRTADMPLLIIDGTRVSDPRALQEISAQNIEQLRMIDGLQAVLTQGTNSGGGVITVITKSAPDSD